MNTLHIYARVSSKTQVEKDLSIDEQIVIGKGIAKKHGFNVKIYKELGKSAFTEDISNRPVYSEILDKIDSGEIKYLYAYDITRLSRNDMVQAVLKKNLQKNRVKLYTSLGQYDFSNSQDQFVFDLMKIVAQHDNATRVRRFKLGNISANRKGKYTKPNIPYGYFKNEKKELEINEEEEKIVLQIVDWYLKEGIGTNKIANRLNKNRILTRKSKNIIAKIIEPTDELVELTHLDNLWNPGSINAMFKNSILYGERKFKVGINEDGSDKFDLVECPAIIDKTTFELIAQKRSKNAIIKKRDPKYFRLLSGLLYCGKCGSTMEGRIKISSGEYTYRCTSKRYSHKSCGSRGINIFKLNNLIWSEFENSDYFKREIEKQITTGYNLSKQELIKKQNQELLTETNKDLEKLDLKYSKIVDLYTDSTISKSVLDEKIKEIDIERNRKLIRKQEFLDKLEILNSEIFKGNKSFEVISRGIAMFSETAQHIIELSSHINCIEKDNEKAVLAREIIRKSIGRIVITNTERFGEFQVDIEYKFQDNPFIFNEYKLPFYNLAPKNSIIINAKNVIKSFIKVRDFF